MATRFQLLPEVVDLSFAFTVSGAGGLIATVAGAALRFEPDRIARIVLLGNLGGGAFGVLLVALVAVGVL